MRPPAIELATALVAATLTAGPARAVSPEDLRPDHVLPAGIDLPTDGRAFVLADLLRLRSSPSTGAAVVVHLRIGTEVEVSEVRTVGERQWAKVSLVDRPAPFAIEGWVASELLTEEQPTMMALHHEVLYATTLAEREMWVDRAMALDPYSPVARDALAILRSEQEAAPPPEPEMDAWIAVCDDGRMMLAAHVDEDGGITSVRPGMGELAAVAGRAWYPAGEKAPLAGTPFPTPFLVGQHGEEGRSPYAEGDYPMGDDDSGLPVMGACHGANVVATRPTRDADLVPQRGNVPDPRAGQLLWVESHALTGTTWTVHQLRVPYKMFGCGGEGDFVEAGIVVLTDPASAITLAMGGPLPPGEGGGAPFASYTAPRWLNLGGDLHLGIAAGEEGTGEGVSLVTLTREHIVAVGHIVIRTWGC